MSWELSPATIGGIAASIAVPVVFAFKLVENVEPADFRMPHSNNVSSSLGYTRAG